MNEVEKMRCVCCGESVSDFKEVKSHTCLEWKRYLYERRYGVIEAISLLVGGTIYGYYLHLFSPVSVGLFTGIFILLMGIVGNVVRRIIQE